MTKFAYVDHKEVRHEIEAGLINIGMSGSLEFWDAFSQGKALVLAVASGKWTCVEEITARIRK